MDQIQPARDRQPKFERRSVQAGHLHTAIDGAHAGLTKGAAGHEIVRPEKAPSPERLAGPQQGHLAAGLLREVASRERRGQRPERQQRDQHSEQPGGRDSRAAGGERHDQRASSASTLAAQMKSFRDSPPTSWVDHKTWQWP